MSIPSIDIDQSLNISPQRQERIDHGVLIRWTKGFGAANIEGEDVAAMFRKSLEKYVGGHLPFFTSTAFEPTVQQLPVELTALINDTTGTLIASHYVNSETKIACIFGTGCNAAYMEHVKDIPKIKDLGIGDDADMAINCEWVRLLIYSSLHFVHCSIGCL